MSNNRVILEGCVKQFKEVNEINLNDSEVFELFSLSQINKASDITFENIQNSIVDGGNDGGIDSILIFINDEIIENESDLENFTFNRKTTAKFVITQCKKEKSFKELVIDKIITTVPIMFDLENDEKALLARFNSDLVSKNCLLRKIWTDTSVNGGKLFIEYNYCCAAANIEINSIFTKKIEQLIDITKKLFSTNNVSYFNFSSLELLEFYQMQQNNRLTLEFKDPPLSTSFCENGIGYVGTINLAKYKEFLTSEDGKIRDDLFESNIRHFQGLVDVNKKIKRSIESNFDRDFWWLNNGITIIAEEPNQIGRKLTIENIQIVNGLQTSYSIFNNLDSSENDERSVLVKIIINNNKEIIDDIIASTNSQNPVSATLLRATETTQRNLELYFLNEGFFYDRRKNYYKNQGKPTTKIFSIQYTAQSIESILFNSPHTARAQPTSLLKIDSNYFRIFNPDKNFKGYLNCCLINRKTHTFWLNIDNNDKKSLSSNFKLHLSWLIPKYILSKQSLDFEDIVDFDLESINIAVFTEVVNFLCDSITMYLTNNESTNLIYIAKSKEFIEFTLKRIADIIS